MVIIRHKSIDLTPEEILRAVIEHKVPSGTVIDISDGTITIGPTGTINLLGTCDQDYEVVFFKEEYREN